MDRAGVPSPMCVCTGPRREVEHCDEHVGAHAAVSDCPRAALQQRGRVKELDDAVFAEPLFSQEQADSTGRVGVRRPRRPPANFEVMRKRAVQHNWWLAGLSLQPGSRAPYDIMTPHLEPEVKLAGVLLQRARVPGDNFEAVCP